MITKERAQLVADELLAAGRHEREAHAAKGIRFMTWYFPGLKDVPASKRYGALRDARTYASHDRLALVLIALASAAFALFISLDVNGRSAGARIAGWCAALFFVSSLGISQMRMRAFLRRMNGAGGK